MVIVTASPNGYQNHDGGFDDLEPRKSTLTHHQGDACARGGVLSGHIVGKNPGKVMA
jgi:hypothetical protein